MYRLWVKLTGTAVAVGVLGVAKLPFERDLTADLREARVLAPPLDIGTREKLDQTAAAVAFGGLRTLVAALWNLRAFGYFEKQDWARLEEAFLTIGTLAPRTRFYWDTGSWHLAYNAAADYLNDESLPPARRNQLWRQAIARGESFLERGIRNNPDDWLLPHRLGRLLDDRNKVQDTAKAAEWFAYSAARGAPGFVARNHFYALGRLPGREDEALALGRRLFADPSNRVPSLNCLYFSLEARVGGDPLALARRIFGSMREAWEQLRIYRERGEEGYPQSGVDEALRALEKELAIPAEESVFRPNP